MGSLSDALPEELSCQDGGVNLYQNQALRSAPSRDSVRIVNQMSTTRRMDQMKSLHPRPQRLLLPTLPEPESLVRGQYGHTKTSVSNRSPPAYIQ